MNFQRMHAFNSPLSNASAMLKILERKPQKIPTKVSYDEFEDFYLSHPWATAQDIADEFGICLRSAYYKLERFNKRNSEKVDVRLSSMNLASYKEGFEQGVIVGAGLGGLTADLLKTHGIGISDLVAWIAKSVKGNDGKTQTQSPTETNSQTASQ